MVAVASPMFFVPRSVSDLEHDLCALASVLQLSQTILQSPLRSTDATNYLDTA